MINLENKSDFLYTKGISLLLEIKDAEIRLLSLYQCDHAVDKAIHVGGAFSATIPMVSLFYGGILNINIENPTAQDQDQFVLSKGHAVATLASIYYDLGYFGKDVLENSRSINSILNGHPGPVLPGVHVATGPMGQGMGVAQGFAIAGQRGRPFDVFTLTGDGELQEGPIWESVMYAGAKNLENLCVLVDHNGGQLDSVNKLHFPYLNMSANFSSFGWNVIEVDATRYHAVYDALLEFKYGTRNGKPTAIICRSTKGFGGYSNQMDNHKTSLDTALIGQESELQRQNRIIKSELFCELINQLAENDPNGIIKNLEKAAFRMGLELVYGDSGIVEVKNNTPAIKLKKAAVRDKGISYQAGNLPKLQIGELHFAHKVIESAMKVFARDQRIFSVDSDLSSTSGLQSGVGYVDKNRAHNVGVAEANMMLIGEALSILGSNVWVSTFCPFYDWKVLRRIAVGHQERLEVIREGGWLSEGHGIDYTMVATAADLETQSNGATHMGNDDALMMNEAAHVKIINVSCPQQLLQVMKWIVSGNKGIVYLRILRAPAKVLYSEDTAFEFCQAYPVITRQNPHGFIVSSGRGVHEAMEASELLLAEGIAIDVIDMPSIDADKIVELYETGKPVFIAEQNNGYLWTNFRKVLFERMHTITNENLFPINLSHHGELQYIHSGTYQELIDYYGLSSGELRKTISTKIKL